MKVIHSVGSFFQMNHPEGRRSSRAHLPHFLVCTKDIKDQALHLCMLEFDILFPFYLKVAGRTASFASFYEQGMRDQDS